MDQHSTLFDLRKFDDVTWRVRKLLLTLIRDQHSFNWIHVQEPGVAVQAGSVVLLDGTFQSFDWEETFVRLFDRTMLFHFLDDVIKLLRIFEICFH